ncbi:hypothetical protein DL764_001368 [Monosporascus ibericus]|uniref:non-specific serine/threonine protein kinase n=1 Tax=Monosporascus ibericus TaxID=155417 RepID=A0A4Q4TPV4_9PEZI|nr:hypothetical protein DL764_001368 [Monosporascus ibericus]
MELIPYTSREGREIVLRHRNALVHESFVDPNYFRMLQAGYVDHEEPQPRPPPSPVRRLTQPALPGYATVEEADDAEFLSSTPAPPEGARIRRDAFSPNYFKRFFVEERELGRGGKGVVLLVRHEIDGCALGHFACKRVPVGDDHAWLEKVLVEVELLAKLSHPNLVSYRHVWLEDVQLHRFGPSVASAFILQQYCNSGDLLRYVIGDQPKELSKEQLKAQMRRRSKGQNERPPAVFASQRRLCLEEIYSLFKDITSGLAYLHGANYIHRDLKPSNCLLHREGSKLTCLISDFGEVQPENAIRKSTGTTGTVSYCAPEVLKADVAGRFGNFTTKSDVFSLGMILYFLCFGRLPYRNANVFQEELEDIDLLRAEIAGWKGFQDERRERPDLPAKLYQLLKRMLAIDPADRPSAAEVLSVMNHETPQGDLRGRTTNPPVGLRHRKIQSLDSPGPPGTPVHDPVKHNYRHSPPVASADDSADDITVTSFSVHSPQASPETSLQKHHHQHEAPAMSFSSSQESHAAHTPHDDYSAVARGLLLAPPSTAHTYLGPPHRVMELAYRNADTISLTFRLALFITKMAALFRPCWPYVPSLEAVVPLVGLAALDLGVPATRGGGQLVRRGWRASLTALVLHFLALAAVGRWGVLCARPRDWMDW